MISPLFFRPSFQLEKEAGSEEGLWFEFGILKWSFTSPPSSPPFFKGGDGGAADDSVKKKMEEM